jgi:cytochrome c-type biogenesis protein CcmE
MDPSRKRTVRLVVALTAAVLLAGALAVTSFSASSEARTPAELSKSAKPGERYQLTGRVQKDTYTRSGNVHTFKVQERAGGASVPVKYVGSVPDPFREGREVIVTVQQDSAGIFVGEKDTLITKCPSKFTKDQQS